MIRAEKPDPRVERTRQNILDAFRDLVLSRGFEAISVRDVVGAAGVGRSTFYEHFEDKVDLFEESFRPLLVILADAVDTEYVSPQLPMVIAHFGDNRRMARVTFAGSVRRLMARFLTDLIEQRLTTPGREPCGSHNPLMPLRLVAAQLAQGQLGLIEAWLSAKTMTGPESLAHGLHASTRASAAALLATSDLR